MILDKEKLTNLIVKYLGIDKENNPDEIKLNNLDTDREYQVKLAKDLWNDKISIEDKFWYPEDYSYIEDILIEKQGFKKIGTIKYGNSDKTFLTFSEWRKEFKIYYNKLDNKILVCIVYENCKDKEWNLTDLKYFIGIFDLSVE